MLNKSQTKLTLELLIQLRSELEGYEEVVSGEHYNNIKLNGIINTLTLRLRQSAY